MCLPQANFIGVSIDYDHDPRTQDLLSSAGFALPGAVPETFGLLSPGFSNYVDVECWVDLSGFHIGCPAGQVGAEPDSSSVSWRPCAGRVGLQFLLPHVAGLCLAWFFPRGLWC